MKDNVYLDNAATTWPKPEPVYVFMDRFQRAFGVNPGRGSHALGAEAERMVRQTRAMLAGCFGHEGSSNRVTFAANGTDALNTAIRGLVRPGDHLVTTRLEHNAVQRTLNHLERDAGLRLSKVALAATGYVDPDAIEAALEPGTRAIVLNHASNVVGTVQPLERIAAIARARGVALIVDAAQTAGVVPVDLAALGVAAFACPGHKGLFGPTGTGVLIVAEGVELLPSRFGGTGVESASAFQPEDYPFRLEAGTMSVPGIAGLHAAQLWLRELGRAVEAGIDPSPAPPLDPSRDASSGESSGGSPAGSLAEFVDERLDLAESVRPAEHGRLCRLAIEAIHARELGLLERIEAMLARYPSVRILGEARSPERVATLSFVVEGRDATEIAERLDADHGICARAGLQCAPAIHEALGTLANGGTVRLSPGWFTDEADLAQLADGFEEVLGTG